MTIFLVKKTNLSFSWEEEIFLGEITLPAKDYF